MKLEAWDLRRTYTGQGNHIQAGILCVSRVAWSGKGGRSTRASTLRRRHLQRLDLHRHSLFHSQLSLHCHSRFRSQIPLRRHPSHHQGRGWELVADLADADKGTVSWQVSPCGRAPTLNMYLQTRYPPGLSPFSVQAYKVFSLLCYTGFAH